MFLSIFKSNGLAADRQGRMKKYFFQGNVRKVSGFYASGVVRGWLVWDDVKRVDRYK
jgi:hypothetical protein